MARVTRWLGYFAALRPSYAFGAVIAVLPLTTLPGAPLGSMVGNLFVDYGFWEAFWFGVALFGAAWAVMLTAGLGLDAERDRTDSWVHDPEDDRPPGARWVTVPIGRVAVFAAFTLLAVPGAVAVVANSPQPLRAAAGLLLGGLAMYAGSDLAISFLRLGDDAMRVLPWRPLAFLWLSRLCSAEQLHALGAPARAFVALAARAARIFGAPAHFFRAPNRLHADHTFAAWTSLFVLALYLFLYRTLRPGGVFYAGLDALPPAGFLYLLVVLVVLVVSFLWVRFRRYRLTFYVFVFWVIAVKLLQSWAPADGNWWLGQPVHTYDVYRLTAPSQELTASEVLAALARAPEHPSGGRTLIVVAAGGGGILAAGWTTKVLSELQRAYPRFRRELRLISAVSGGSVGAVHYAHAHDRELGPLSDATLEAVVRNSLETSLSAAAYGFAFPDFHRLLLPLAVPELDRGRLQELRWQDTASATPGQGEREVELLASWSDDVRAGFKPALILNATVLESGERVAITPLFSLREAEPTDAPGDWAGWRPRGSGEPVPRRQNSARTLSEFLTPAAQRSAAGYTVDVWTAARLSATFAYVSPPARARLRCRDQDQGCGQGELAAQFAPLHLIDGGYHENFGVASALDWLTRAVRSCLQQRNCPFTRIALVEIRATPVAKIAAPASEWIAAWLGPAAGLMNSWAFAQTSANDTNVDRLLRRMRDLPVPFESFVFEPEVLSEEASPAAAATECCKRSCCPGYQARRRDFALSWHLSVHQKAEIDDYWRDARNQCALRAFLRFVDCGDAQAPCAAADARLRDPCTPAESMRPLEDAEAAQKAR
jgi:hypothetical protein